MEQFQINASVVNVSVVFPFGDHQVIPKWGVWALLGVVSCCGWTLNGLLGWNLGRAKLFPVLVHLTITDLITLLVVGPTELFVLSSTTLEWNFPSVYCPVFLSLEVILGTASVYFLILFNLSCMLGDDASCRIPLALVWTLSFSLGIPHLVMSSLVHPSPETSVCTIPNIASFLLYTFRVGLPTVFLAGSTVLAPTPMSLLLTLSHVLLSFPRCLLSLVFTTVSGVKSFHTPPLAPIAPNPQLTFLLSSMHYLLLMLRPSFYWLASPEIRAILKKSPTTSNA